MGCAPLFPSGDPMTCWVYVLRDCAGRHYVGITSRLRKRLVEHNRGRTRADAGRGPFEVVYKEPHPDHKSARNREKFLKSGLGREWLRKTLGERSLPAEGG